MMNKTYKSNECKLQMQIGNFVLTGIVNVEDFEYRSSCVVHVFTC